MGLLWKGGGGGLRRRADGLERRASRMAREESIE